MKSKIIYLLTTIFAFFLGIIGTIVVIKYIPEKNNINEVNENQTVNNVNITETNTIKTAINEIYDAVVLVETYNNDNQISSGTGFVYKKDLEKGYIITNQHVVENGTKFIITLTNNEEIEATLLGSDVYSDIAVLSINPASVTQIAKLGESSKSEIGDTVFAVGSPLGKEYMGTVTKGILSGKDRTVTVTSNNNSIMLEVLQTDAAINPGNSGGPLVNINGEVIGVNSMKLVQDEIEGMGFSIPIELVTSLIDKLEKGEKITRPLIGVEMTDITNSYYLYTQRIMVPEEIEKGVVITKTTQDYPAAKAGLQKGDIILEINDNQIKDSAHFKYLLYKFNVGDNVKIKYYREGKIQETNMLLDKSVE